MLLVILALGACTKSKLEQTYNSQESKAITNSPTYNVTVVADMSKIRSVQDVIDIITGIPQSNGTGGVVVV